MTEVENCLFCSTLPEDAWVATQYGIALPAPRPLMLGHVVVAPRRHVPAFYDLDVEEQGGLWVLVSLVRKHFEATLNLQSAAIGFADGNDGQGHTHIHVVPHRPGMDLPEGIQWVKDY